MLELPDRTRTVLDALVGCARPVILAEYKSSSCIASTRVGVDVLAYFGVPAKPVPVSLLLMNAEAVRVYEQTENMQAVHTAAMLVPADVAGGAWTIGVGVSGEHRVYGEGDWPGHLAIGLKPYNVLVDLSLDQAARPLKNIAAKPVWYPVPGSWWGAAPDSPAVLAGPDGSYMMVHRTPNESFRVSPNWKPDRAEQRSRLRKVTGEVIGLMRAMGVEPVRV
ncbi:MAG: hypothetical protein ACOH1Y_16780 [Propionicimonas sp.]